MLPIYLNGNWRVVDLDEAQWSLQMLAKLKKGGEKWNNRSFCVTRKALLRCIGEYCGEVDPAALAVVEAFPEKHP